MTPGSHAPKKITRSIQTVVSGLAVAAVIGWADHVSGPRIGLSLFYLIPVAAAAWYGRRVAAIIVAVAAASAWTIAELSWLRDGGGLGISLWNAFTRLVIYVSGALLLSALRSDRERLKKLVSLESELARTDGLTGILNVRGFLAASERAITTPDSFREMSLVYFDLDNFKKFNDRLGHAAGDSILVEVARILQESSERGEHHARIGGDEFASLLRRNAIESERWAREVVDAIRAIGAPYPEVQFGATAGVASFSTPPESAEEMLRTADDAMYRGKTARRGSVVVVDASQTASLSDEN